MSYPRPHPAAVLGAILLALACGCDKKDRPFRPVPATNPSLETLWPHEDGRTWNYFTTARTWADVGPRIYQDRDSVPPIPTLSVLEALLGNHPIGSSPTTDTATFQLQFDGQMTTSSGVTAQYLKETVLRPPIAATSSVSWPTMGLPRGFLRDLITARPDVARKLGLVGSGPAGVAELIQPYAILFLFGYAWESTSEWIGSYGDVDMLLAWKYLIEDLTPGREFTHQLVPSLASDVFLHARILNRRTVQTPAGTFHNAIVCLYGVDYGIGEGQDDRGNPTGFFRHYSYGTVAYADSVGPVGCYERLLVGVGNPSRGIIDHTLMFSSTGVTPSARVARVR